MWIEYGPCVPPPVDPVEDGSDNETDFLAIPTPSARMRSAQGRAGRGGVSRSNGGEAGGALPVGDDVDGARLADQLEHIMGISMDDDARRAYEDITSMLDEAESAA